MYLISSIPSGQVRYEISDSCKCLYLEFLKLVAIYRQYMLGVSGVGDLN